MANTLNDKQRQHADALAKRIALIPAPHRTLRPRTSLGLALPPPVHPMSRASTFWVPMSVDNMLVQYAFGWLHNSDPRAMWRR